MPVNPLPPSNTWRYYIDYTSMEIEHTVIFRTDGEVGDIAAFFGGIFNGMAAMMRLADSIRQVRYSTPGSDVTIPVYQVNVSGLVANAGAIGDDPESVFISAPFRGLPSGRKGRYSFYFPVNAIPADVNNRFEFGSVPTLEPLEDALFAKADVGLDGIHLSDISASRILFNTYWNRAKNSYWQRKQRLG